MGLDDKIKNTAEKVAGAAKEKWGDATAFVKTARDDGKGLFVLVRTSNPGSAELQDVKTEDGRTFSSILFINGGMGARATGDREVDDDDRVRPLRRREPRRG